VSPPADCEGAAGECELHVVGGWEPAGLSDDQPVSRGGDEGGSAEGVHWGAVAADRRGVCEVGELFCRWDESGDGCQSA